MSGVSPHELAHALVDDAISNANPSSKALHSLNTSNHVASSHISSPLDAISLKSSPTHVALDSASSSVFAPHPITSTTNSPIDSITASSLHSTPNNSPTYATKATIQALLEGRIAHERFTSLSTLPHPYSLKSCQQASAFLAQALLKHPKILIVGDYDVDGVIASVVMMKFFAAIGYAHVEYVIPNRFYDGYGVSRKILQEHPSDIVITVDNGITAHDAALYCKEKGISLIVTDHHMPKDTLPEATFIINPQQKDCSFPQKEISGALVAWYFCAGVKIALNNNLSIKPLLELVMLATIADMMPLTEINKCIVRYGLRHIAHSKIPALRMLKTRLKTPYITATDISFTLTPLLNSPGRMSDARVASEFLLLDAKTLQTNLHAALLIHSIDTPSNTAQDTPLASSLKPIYETSLPSSHISSSTPIVSHITTAKASTISTTSLLQSALKDGLAQLLSINQMRKDIANTVLEAAKRDAICYPHAVIARGDSWHEGVLGIVATQVAHTFKRTSFVLGKTQEGSANMLKGSVRAWGEIDVIELLHDASGILGEFGGHSKAAGFSLEERNFSQFCAYLEGLSALPKARDEGDRGVFMIDPCEITWGLFRMLERFEPYGVGNPKPIFKAYMRIASIQEIKQHRKLQFVETNMHGMYFFCEEEFFINDVICAEFTLQMDAFTHKPMMIISHATHAVRV